jgi:DNA-binding transcriptional LysR family regulator
MKQPDLNLLIALDALLSEGSVSRAAARCGLSTPAMSHALARLRTQLGDPLLVRAGQRMVPTARASSLRDRAASVVREARDMMSPSAPPDLRHLARTFQITASDHAVTMIGSALDRELRAAPAVNLHITSGRRDEVTQLRDGAIDLAIGVYDYSPYSDLPADLRMQQLYEDQFACVVRADHPTATGRALSLEQYAALEHVQIAPRGNVGGYVDELLAVHGLTRRIVRAVPYFLAGLVLVADSDYVLTISHAFAKRMAAPLNLRILAPPKALGLEPYSTVQLWHPRNDRDPAHRWLRERVVAASAAARSRPRY